MKDKSGSNYCTIYIVRHGETEWNVEGILQGQKDSPLTKKGLTQAKKAAQLLKDIEFDLIFSSDLIRAKRTAEIIALDHKLAVQTTELLRERYFGKFQGKTAKEYRVFFSKELDERKRLTLEERKRYKIADDIESDEEIISRIFTFLRETALAYPNRNILMASHGGIMRALLIHLGFAGYENLGHGSITNTAFIKLRSDGVEFFIDQTYGISLNK